MIAESLHEDTTWVCASVYWVWNIIVGPFDEVSEGKIKTARTKVKIVSIVQLLLTFLRLGSLNQSLSSYIKGLS